MRVPSGKMVTQVPSASRASPWRITWAKAGYAYTTLVAAEAQDVLLLAGSNSRLAVFLDGRRVHAFDGDRNAVADADTVRRLFGIDG